MTRIVLADDHPIVRQGLRALLSAEQDFQLVEETGDGLEAVRLVERLKPDILIVDIMMPGLNGLEVTREVHLRTPETKIVILSMHADEGYVYKALQNGAVAYILKDTRDREMIQGIRDVIQGKRYLSPQISERALQAYAQKTELTEQDSYHGLTTREREVLYLAAGGYTSQEIADRLFISSRTVEIHRSNLMHKLNLDNQTDLVCYAIHKGIIKVETDFPRDTKRKPDKS